MREILRVSTVQINLPGKRGANHREKSGSQNSETPRWSVVDRWRWTCTAAVRLRG